MYSALKRDGVPLYRLARAGVEVEREARRVVIERADGRALRLAVADVLRCVARKAPMYELWSKISRARPARWATSRCCDGSRSIRSTSAADADLRGSRGGSGSGYGSARQPVAACRHGLAELAAGVVGAGRCRTADTRSSRGRRPRRGSGPCQGLRGVGPVHRHRRRGCRATGADTGFSSLTAWSGTEYFGMMRAFQVG